MLHEGDGWRFKERESEYIFSSVRGLSVWFASHSVFFFQTLPSILAVINIKCQQHDKQVHQFSLACHYRYNLEGRDTAAVVSV